MKITTQDRIKTQAVSMSTIVEGTGVTVRTTDKALYVTEFTVPSSTQAVAGASLGFGKLLGTLPKGNIVVESVSVDLTTVFSGAGTDAPEVGVGTVIATGAIGTIGAGAGTMEDCMDGTTSTTLTGAVAVDTAVMVHGEVDQKDGTSTAKSLYLNWADPWAATGTFTYSGKVTVAWYIAHKS